MANDLFKNFKPVTDQEWEAVLDKELKGASRADKLVWKAPDGFLIQPYYRRKPIAENGTAENGGIRSILNRTYGNKWEIRAEIDVIQPDKAIELAEKLMQREVNAIEFRVDSSLSESFRERLTKEGIRSVSNMILRDFPEDKLDIDKPLPKTIQLDLLGSLAKKGNYCKFAEYDWHQLSTHVVGPLRNTRCILVDATIWQNAGATPALELALAIAAGHEYMVKLRSYGIEHTKTCKQLSIRMAAGSDFFSEIAKFRAIRLLWKLVLEPYTPKDRGPFIPEIQGANARWNKSRADRYNNLVRATMESTAAIMGGADSFSVLPHDGVFRIPSSFSRRIADNVQHILKSEAYLDKVADPAAGSWYIETLTDEIAAKAWAIFKEIEAQGGFEKALLDGWISNRVNKAKAAKIARLKSGKEVLIGITHFVNKGEQLPEAEELPPIQPYKRPLFKPVQPLSADDFAVEKTTT